MGVPKKNPIQQVAKALAIHPQGLDSSELLTSLVRIWGGCDRLAASVHEEFQHAKPGSMTRQRMLEMIQRLVVANTDRELSKVKHPSDMSNDELQEFARTYLTRMMGHHGEETTPAAG